MRTKLWATASVAGVLATVLATVALSAGASPEANPTRAWGRGVVDVGDSGRESARAPQSHEGGDTIVVRPQEVAAKDVNVNGPRFGPGDYFLFKDRLTNSAGTHVGNDNVVCMAHFPFTRTRFGVLCEGTFSFFGRGGIERGKIAVEGLIVFRQGVSSFAIPITGGTRHYQNVRGELHVPAQGANLTLHLIP